MEEERATARLFVFFRSRLIFRQGGHVSTHHCPRPPLRACVCVCVWTRRGPPYSLPPTFSSKRTCVLWFLKKRRWSSRSSHLFFRAG